jgi:hypothetical protein
MSNFDGFAINNLQCLKLQMYRFVFIAVEIYKFLINLLLLIFNRLCVFLTKTRTFFVFLAYCSFLYADNSLQITQTSV